MKKISKKNTGYTIIETMIAVSLFLVVVMIGMGALLNANLIHQKSQSMRSIMDNLSFIMEDMSKNLRTGYNYYCITGGDNLSSVAIPQSGPSCWGIAFEPANGDSTDQDGDPVDDNDQWVYYIGPDTSLPGNPFAIWKSTAGPYNTSSFIKLTPDEVVIDSASSFSVFGAEPPETPYSSTERQPFVTIKLVGKIILKGVEIPFSLQTSVSQRLIDV